MADKSTVYQGLSKLGAIFPSIERRLQKGPLLEIWCDALETYTDAAVLNAMERYLLEGEYPPKPRDIIGLLGGRSGGGSDPSARPDGCDFCSGSGTVQLAVARYEPLEHPREMQRIEVRTFVVGCDCTLGVYYVKGGDHFKPWALVHERMCRHGDTCQTEDNQPAVWINPAPRDTWAWEQPLQGRQKPPLGRRSRPRLVPESPERARVRAASIERARDV